MSNETTLVNRVSNSKLVTIKLEPYLPQKPIVSFDLKPFLFKEWILKEADFRQALKELDWNQYENKMLAVWCSNDAIVPTWAYMLIAKHAAEKEIALRFGNPAEVTRQVIGENINQEDWSQYESAKVVIKGCSDLEVPASAYLLVTSKLIPFANSIMYGEPCSTVPVYKKAR
ncbi:MAG: DUF2480 family protein [Saprospiraceae bacterium]|nr:DUF2480 family protein [Saprospiraceae bacterium]